jgi:YD repeat-containing protein
MKTLSLEFLNQYNACKEGIMFVKNNNLLNFPFDLLNEIKGDHNGYIKWLKACIGGGYEYDKNHYKTSNGYEEWKEYDQNNNLIHYKISNGYEEWKSYDERNNIVYYKNSNGIEYWINYDQNNNVVHIKNSNGIEYWKEYDQNSNLIHYKNSKGYEYWINYDVNNNLIHYKDSTGIEYSNEIEYYPDGQLKKYNELELPYFEKITT